MDASCKCPYDTFKPINHVSGEMILREDQSCGLAARVVGWHEPSEKDWR